MSDPIDRYVVNDRSGLRYNADGSPDLYLQHDKPSDSEQLKNWLPAPPAGDAANPGQAFRLIMRLYGITPSAFGGVQSGAGWRAPTVLPCDASGHTATGWACAS